MSLRHQILYRVLFSSLCILVLGGAMVIWQAKQAVTKEVDASIHLALQLMDWGIADAPVLQQGDDLSRFSSLRQTRHLRIEVRKPNGQLLQFAGAAQSSDPERQPPAWFIAWMQSDYPEVQHQLQARDGSLLTLIIKAQPLDEITEIWQESLAFFAAICLLTLLTFVAVNLVFNKSLKSIAVIVDALQRIEMGQYRLQLPSFSTREFDDIARAIDHMTAELEKTRQENRALTQHSLAIQEEERRHLSQELHDEFGQSLTAIKVMAVTAALPQSDVNNITTAIRQICDHLMAVLRSMMQQLHPLVLSELGLKATLEEMVHHWSERNPSLKLMIDCHEVVDSLDKNLGIQVFRVIQECLTNVVRHANARKVNIQLDLVSDPSPSLRLQVSDDGQGCEPESLLSGFGLRGMQERVQSLEGQLQLQTRPGQGMTVTAVIPLSRAENTHSEDFS